MSGPGLQLPAPYPGLRPFEEVDSPIFFGRESQVIAMLRQLATCRFLAVVGSSGSGKSSLVRAGALPAVRRGFLVGTKDWLIVPPVKPGNDPYGHLALALTRCLPASSDGNSEAAVDGIEETLRATDRGLLDALAKLGIPRHSKVMVVVDQFEELFAFRRARQDTLQTASGFASRDEAAAFVSMLLRSCAEDDGQVSVVLTMRSDFIGDCEAFLGLPEIVSTSQFLVPRLDRRQMAEAICGPGELKDHAFAPFVFADGLVTHIINEAGDRPDQLPLMQHALMRTWKTAAARAARTGATPELTFDDYERTAGGIKEALHRHADSAWDQIESDRTRAAIARRLFLLLCDVAPDGQITRRRPQVREVMAATGASLEAIESVVRVFQNDDRNFLLPLLDQTHLSPDDYLDISHESLLRQWKRFADDWLFQERKDAAELRRLMEQADLYDEDKGGLLAHEDLDRVLPWRRGITEQWARRYVPEDVWKRAMAFVDESDEARQSHLVAERERAENRLLWRRLGMLAAAAVAGVSLWLMLRADRASKTAEGALTTSFVRTIGVSEESSFEEEEALWELAGLDSSKVRERVIGRWFDTAGSLQRALRHDSRGLRAAVGLNSDLQELINSKAAELAESSAAATTATPGALDLDRLSSRAAALEAVAKGLEPAAAAAAAEELVEALENRRLTDADVLSNLTVTLMPVAARLQPAAATGLAARLANALANPDEDDYDRLSSLGTALVALAKRMDGVAAAGIAETLVKVVANPLEEDEFRLQFLQGTLVDLIMQLDPTLAAPMVEGLARLLEEPQTTPLRQITLQRTLGALSARSEPAGVVLIKPATAADVAEGLATDMRDQQKANAYRQSTLSLALAGVARSMEPAAAANVSARGAQALVTSLAELRAPTTPSPSPTPWPISEDPTFWSHATRALEGLSARMHPAAAADIAGDLVTALEDPRATGTSLRAGLAVALAAPTKRMESAAAAGVAARGARVMVQELAIREPTFSRVRPPWAEPSSYMQSRALAGLAAYLEPATAAEAAERLAGILEDPGETSPRRLVGLVAALKALADRMEPARAAGVAQRLLAALKEIPEADVGDLSSSKAALGASPERTEAMTDEQMALHEAITIRRSLLGAALAALATRMEPSAAAAAVAPEAQILARALTDPLATTDSLSSLESALADLAKAMRPAAAASVAGILVNGMENQRPTDAARLASLGGALVAVAARLEPTAAADAAASGARELVEALDEPSITNREHLPRMGAVLAALATGIGQPARNTQLLALSTALGGLSDALGDPEQELAELDVSERQDWFEDALPDGERELATRQALTNTLASLSTVDLLEILKWPFCVGAAEKTVLTELRSDTHQSVGDDVWQLVELVENGELAKIDRQIDREFLIAPARRPSPATALRELGNLVSQRQLPR